MDGVWRLIDYKLSVSSVSARATPNCAVGMRAGTETQAGKKTDTLERQHSLLRRMQENANVGIKVSFSRGCKSKTPVFWKDFGVVADSSHALNFDQINSLLMTR